MWPRCVVRGSSWPDAIMWPPLMKRPAVPQGGLPEVGRDDVAHLEEVADMHVLGRDLAPHGGILGFVAHQMQVIIAEYQPRLG